MFDSIPKINLIYPYCVQQNHICESLGIDDGYTCNPLCGDVNGHCLDPNQLCVTLETGFECQDICGLNITNNGPCSGNRLCSENNSTLLCSDDTKSNTPCSCSTICGDVDGAVAIFRRAIELEPDLHFDPETEAHRLAEEN